MPNKPFDCPDMNILKHFGDRTDNDEYSLHFQLQAWTLKTQDMISLYSRRQNTSSDCNGTRNHDHFVRRRTFDHLAKQASNE